MKKTYFLALLLFCFYTIYAQKPKNIILLIGDGMGIATVYAGYSANQGFLNMQRCPFTGFSKTYSLVNYITDSSAGATALSSGQKTRNGYVAMDTLGNSLKTILEYAEEHKKSTGLISTSSVTHATPASFIAHAKSRKLDEDIAKDFLATDIDVFIGGGRKYFAERKDGINYIDTLKRNGYQICNSMDDVKKANHGKIAGLVANGHNKSYAEGRGNMLPESVGKALEILSQNQNGFFIMIEGSMIDWAAHDNNQKEMVEELLDFDRAVAEALKFAEKDKNTLVIVTADHETGGVTLQGGNIKNGTVDVKFSTKDHTGVMVPVFAYGPGAEMFSGMYENTAIFDKMMFLFGFNK